MTSRVKLALKLIISAILLWLLSRTTSLKDGLNVIATTPPASWLGITICIGLATALGAYRWYLAAGKNIPLKTCLTYYWTGLFYSYVLPGSLAGDLARTVSLAANEPQFRAITLPMSVFVDRLSGLLTTLLVLVAALTPLLVQKIGILAFAGLMAIFVLGLLGLPRLSARLTLSISNWPLLPAKIRQWLQTASSEFSKMPATRWGQILGLSLLIQVASYGSYIWAIHATGAPGDPWKAALYYALFNLAVLLPITIGGIGLREHFAIWLLGQSNNGTNSASLAASWLILAASLIHVLIGAGLHFAQVLRSPRPTSDTP